MLFLDEPAVGPDPQTRASICNYINDLKRRGELARRASLVGASCCLEHDGLGPLGPRDSFRARLARPERGFDAVVVGGEPQRAFYGNQFGNTFPVFEHYGMPL